MRAMVLDKPGTMLYLKDIPIPLPGPGQLRIKVSVCGICRTDLHVVDGELPYPKLPLVPGHQIVGQVEKLGEGVFYPPVGTRVGVPWLGGSCGICLYCKEGRENLCDHAIYTGYQIDGGFAEYCVCQANYCFPLANAYPDLQAAPLLCAGVIGYRALRMSGDAHQLGFFGFGASAHILTQLANFQGREVYAFCRGGDVEAVKFAIAMGAKWAGYSGDMPPSLLDAAIIFASDGSLIPTALKTLKKGGKVVCAGIHMSDIPSFPYSILWEERSVQSVANLTRLDAQEFLKLAPQVPLHTVVTEYPLEKVNVALEDLRQGKFSGAAVIRHLA